ncbi:hypothetical protein PDE_03835 [Penicillium oxalicum 114-2]|uniref:Secreted protein n=1 Tax=Penicillium oxalicum (strain 114-2 / CGMCC 5302) TaxID=933388 RepID=S7ZF46_PENO1|nr:hypothetical protein PDE_03835 [Penicillium oxalicum 114-2]
MVCIFFWCPTLYYFEPSVQCVGWLCSLIQALSCSVASLSSPSGEVSSDVMGGDGLRDWRLTMRMGVFSFGAFAWPL